MTENPRSAEEKIIKDIRNLFRLKKEQKDTVIEDIRNLFRLQKGVKGTKDIVLRNIKNLFEYEKEENYYKPVRVNNFWSNNHIEYKSNSDKNRIPSVEEYLDNIRPYLRDIINDHKQSDTWKIQLTITHFFSSEDDNDGERVMHSKSDNNIKTMISDEVSK